jgi:hypothetical protein
MESKYRTRYTEEQKQEAMRLKSTGLSNEKVAELTGIGVGPLRKWQKLLFLLFPKKILAPISVLGADRVHSKPNSTLFHGIKTTPFRGVA